MKHRRVVSSALKRTAGALAFAAIFFAASGALAQDPGSDNLIVDAENEQVYVPGEGWMSADNFWLLYNEEPEKLPGSPDFGPVVDAFGYPGNIAVPVPEPARWSLFASGLALLAALRSRRAHV